jgi:hypothetical protein
LLLVLVGIKLFTFLQPNHLESYKSKNTTNTGEKMRKKKAFADAQQNNVVYLDDYKLRKAAIKQAEQLLHTPFSKTETCTTRTLNGQLFVDHFDDGTQTFNITGFYRIALESAMASAIGLAAFTRDQWKASGKNHK